MNNKVLYFILVVLFTQLCVFESSAQQHKILLLNGKTIYGDVTDTVNAEIEYKFYKRNGKKIKERSLEKDRVFSITDTTSGEETVFYYQDTVFNYSPYSVEEMRYYIKGEQDAMRGYKPRATFIFGFITGLGIVMWDTYGEIRQVQSDSLMSKGFFHEEPGIINVAWPLLYTAGAAIPKVKINVSSIHDKSYLNHDAYLDGYERVARSKKVFSAVKGSALGVVTGIVSYFIFNPDIDNR